MPTRRMRVRLLEDDGGIGLASGMADSPYGMHFGSGNQLYSTFVKPFVDVGKTAAGKTAELSARAQTAVKVAFEALATSLVPILSSDYAEIFANEKEKLDSIKQRYSDVYNSSWSALGGTDVTVAAFMFAPWAFLSKALVTKSPGAALSLIKVLGGGSPGIDKFVANAKSKLGGHGKTDATASKWNSREEARMDSMAFEGAVFLGCVILEDNADTRSGAGPDEGARIMSVLTGAKLKKALMSSQIVQRMQQDGRQIVNGTLKNVLTRAQRISNAKTLDELERAIGKGVPQLAQLRRLPQGQREVAAGDVLKRVKSSALKLYATGLKKQAQAAIEAGVARDNPYIKAYAAAIKQIESLGDS